MSRNQHNRTAHATLAKRVHNQRHVRASAEANAIGAFPTCNCIFQSSAGCTPGAQVVRTWHSLCSSEAEAEGIPA